MPNGLHAGLCSAFLVTRRAQVHIAGWPSDMRAVLMNYIAGIPRRRHGHRNPRRHILAMIVARISACRSACHRNNFRKSRVSDVSASNLVRLPVSVSVWAPWNSSLYETSRLRSFRAAFQTGQTRRSSVKSRPHQQQCRIQEGLALASMARDDPPARSTASSTRPQCAVNWIGI